MEEDKNTRQRNSLLEVSVDEKGKISLTDTGLPVTGKAVGGPRTTTLHIKDFNTWFGESHPVEQFTNELHTKAPSTANAYCLCNKNEDELAIQNDELYNSPVQFYKLTNNSIARAFGLKSK